MMSVFIHQLYLDPPPDPKIEDSACRTHKAFPQAIGLGITK